MALSPPRSPVDPSIGIIVVNFNGGTLVLDALASLYRQTTKPHRVVVIDNASDDGSPAEIAVAYPAAELVVLDRNRGFAAANNLAIEMLDDCEYVALLNPDAYADEAWLESIMDAAEAHGEFASFASRIEQADDLGLLESAGDVYHVRHVGGASSAGRSEFAIYYSQRNLVWTYAKSMPSHLFWRYLPLHVLLNVGSIVSYGIRGHGRVLLRAKRDAIRGLPSALRVRRSVMESADFDRVIFDGNVRRGMRVLLRKNRP